MQRLDVANLASHGAAIRHPIELNNAARADERLVTVIRIVAAPKRH